MDWPSFSISLATTVTGVAPGGDTTKNAEPLRASVLSSLAFTLTDWFTFQLAGVNVSDVLLALRSVSPPDCFRTGTTTFEAGADANRTSNEDEKPSGTARLWVSTSTPTAALVAGVITSCGWFAVASSLAKVVTALLLVAL